MTDKQLEQIQEGLSKDGLYIHAAVSDTGRLQVRAYPWSTKRILLII